MKRWLLFAFVSLVVLSSAAVVVVHARLSAQSPPRQVDASLMRVPHSAYKYQLCREAYAFVLATADNPYKTNDTFPDPFRHANDTIIPHFLGLDSRSGSFSFSVDMNIGQLATFHQTITHVQRLDGISILLPDAHNRLQHSSIPQFIVSSIQGTGYTMMAVLDFTCPDQWAWT